MEELRDCGLEEQYNSEKSQSDGGKNESKSAQEETLYQQWVEFATRTTLHGMKVCGYSGDGERQSKLRRCLLLSLVVVNLVFFLQQLIMRCYNYSLYHSHVDVQVVYQKYLEFPSITLCNQNNFRISETLSAGSYPQVLRLLGSTSESNFMDVTESSQEATENLTEFVLKTSHLKEDFIYSCTWAGEQCDLDEDFKSTMTEFFTLCYTYNWNRTSVKKVYQPGVAFSLRLKVNIESYEYFDSVKNNLGIKVLIHPQSELPQVGELGFSVPPGTHTLVAIIPVKSEHLPSPYGTCVPDAIPRSKCFAEIKRKKLKEKCGCTNLNLDSPPDDHWNHSSQVCNVTKAFDCAIFDYTIEDILPDGFLSDSECSVPCTRTTYLEEISYAQLSRLDVRQFEEKNNDKYQLLRNKIRQARAASDTIRSVTTGRESHLVKQILENERSYLQSLNDLKTIMSNGDPPGALEGAKNVMVLDHRLTTDEDLLADLKYLFEDYRYKKKLVLDPQPELNYYILFVKIICGFTESEFWIDSDRKHSEPDGLKDTFQSDYSDNSLEHFRSAEPINIERLLDKCARAESNNSVSNKFYQTWDEFYSCDDDDIFTYLGVRKIQLKNAEEFRDSALKNLDEAVEIRRENSEILFANTTYSSFLSSNQNLKCLDQLENVLQVWINRTHTVFDDAIKKYLVTATSWPTKLGIYYFLKEFVFNLQQSNDSLFNGINFIECDWNFRNDSTLKETNPFANSHFGLFLAYIEATEASFGHLNSLKSRAETTKRIEATATVFGELFGNISNNLEKFLNSNLTRKQLLEHLTRFSESFQSIIDLNQEVILDQTSFLMKLTSFRSNMYQACYHMTNLPLPVLNDSNLIKLKINHIARDHLLNGTEEAKFNALQEILANMTTSREASMLSLINFLYQEYESVVEKQTLSVDRRFKMFSDSLGGLKDVLLKTSIDPDLDENFLRENMVNLDIFFKDIKLKKVQQKPSTSILTLFSEVGSGMSLLLGASVLTFCELVDFVLVLVSSKFKVQKTVVGERERMAEETKRKEKEN